MQIERLTASHFEEAIDFINMVFSMNHRPMDFVKYLPRIYKPTDEAMSPESRRSGERQDPGVRRRVPGRLASW